MQLVGCNICCNEVEWLPYAIKSIYNVIDKFIVIDGAFEGMYSSPESTDGTIEAIEKLDIDNKIKIISPSDFWQSFEEKKNEWFKYTTPGDWLVTFDSDEIYKSEDLLHIKSMVRNNPDFEEIRPIYLHFYGDFWHLIKPCPGDATISHQRIYKHKTNDYYKRHTSVPKNKRLEVSQFYIYHYAWAKKINECIFKINYYNNRLPRYLSPKKDPNIIAKFKNRHNRIFNDSDFARQFLLKFDGNHPEIMKKHPLYNHKMNINDDILQNWNEIPEYDGKHTLGDYTSFKTGGRPKPGWFM